MIVQINDSAKTASLEWEIRLDRRDGRRRAHQEPVWVDRSASHPDLVVQVRSGDTSRASHAAQDFALTDLLPGDHIELREVSVVALHPVVVRNDHQPAIAAEELRVRHDTPL